LIAWLVGFVGWLVGFVTVLVEQHSNIHAKLADCLLVCLLAFHVHFLNTHSVSPT
jgi:hypothetical protein